MKTIPYGHQSISRSDIKAVINALRSGWLTQGPKVGEFESGLCRYAGAKYAAAVSSGTAALHVAALAAGIGPGDEVITSPLTFAASANCILYCGGRPVFSDIEPDTAGLDPAKIEEHISRKTKAIIPVHFSGHPCDMGAISRIAKKRGLAVIEDAAHALGARYRGSKTGSCRYSDMAVLSFHPIKHITTGEGGAVLTNDRKTYERMLRLRHHGIVRGIAVSGGWKYDIPEVGFNYRLTDIQCALGISQLKRSEAFLISRRAAAGRYSQGLAGIDGIRLPCERPGIKSSYHLYVIRVPENRRDKLYKYLRANGVLTQVNYFPVHLFSYYRKKFGFRKGDLPVAEKYSRQCLSLPIYADLSTTDQHKVMDKIRKFFRK